ncbi:hypothetical protein AtEden1_Chr2g0269211 [Arabidopsis thaliana]
MERECEEGEMEKKLRRSFMGYTRRAGPSTPPPTWRLEFSPPRVGATKEFLANSEDSVRKLCADLWETEQFRQRIELRRCRRRDSDVESHSRRPLHDHGFSLLVLIGRKVVIFTVRLEYIQPEKISFLRTFHRENLKVLFFMMWSFARLCTNFIGQISWS